MGSEVPPGWQEGSCSAPKPFRWGSKTVAFASQPKHTVNGTISSTRTIVRTAAPASRRRPCLATCGYMRLLGALLCLCPLAMPKTVTISNTIERRDVCVASVLGLPPSSFARPPSEHGMNSGWCLTG